jgi:hypothetical protein
MGCAMEAMEPPRVGRGCARKPFASSCRKSPLSSGPTTKAPCRTDVVPGCRCANHLALTSAEATLTGRRALGRREAPSWRADAAIWAKLHESSVLALVGLRPSPTRHVPDQDRSRVLSEREIQRCGFFQDRWTRRARCARLRHRLASPGPLDAPCAVRTAAAQARFARVPPRRLPPLGSPTRRAARRLGALGETLDSFVHVTGSQGV